MLCFFDAMVFSYYMGNVDQDDQNEKLGNIETCLL